MFQRQTLLSEERETSYSLPSVGLFAVLPSYNEGEALVGLARQFRKAVKNYHLQLIVIDDGSTDGSIELLEEANLPWVDVIRHEKNKGLGEAVKTGFLVALERATDDDILMVMDADGTHSPFLIERMAQRVLEGNDVVVASRYRYGSRIIGLEAYRQWLSVMASWVYRFTMAVPNIRDYTCGFRLYRANILRQAFRKYGNTFITESGFACMAEILVKLNKLDAICCEVPMILRYDQKVSVSKIKILNTIKASLMLVVRFLLGKGRS